MRHHRPSFRLSLAACALLALWLLPAAVLAHGDLHQRIQALSALIATKPDDAALRLQRADLLRQHGEFPDALADLAAAAKLNTDRRIILLAQARVFSDAGHTTNVLRAADEFLALESNSAEAFTLRARARFKENQVQGAIADFTAALGLSATPEPDLYLERARAQAALGQFVEAIKGLDEGMARVGPIAPLLLAALAYDRQRGAFSAALARLDKHTAQQPVKEPWLVLRGEILLQAGQLAGAKLEFQKALAGIAAYPQTRRDLPMTQELQARARAGLARAETRIAANANHQAPTATP